MGRMDHGRKANNNKKKISQDPNQVGGLTQEEVELSEELDASYEMEEKPGFRPTAARRKED